MPGRSVITLQMGQCGNMVGFEFWKTLCAEHNIDPQGQLRCAPETGPGSVRDVKETFFYESDSGRYVPRSILVDLEPRVLQNIATSDHRGLFNPENFYESSHGGGAGNNWASGYTQAQGEMEEKVFDMVDREAENCDSLEGFFLTHSISGGTGSGAGSYMMEQLASRYGKKLRVSFSVFPNHGAQDVVVAPYNSMLTMARLAREMEAVVVLDNTALDRIATERLHLPKADFAQTNNLVAQIMSATTSLIRFPTWGHNTLGSLVDDLVPIPELKFLFTGFTPLLGRSEAEKAKAAGVMAKTSVVDVLRRLLQPANQMISTAGLLDSKTRSGTPHAFLSLTSIVQGEGLGPDQLHQGTMRMREMKACRFVPWGPACPRVLEAHRSPHVPNPHRVSGLLLANHTGISQLCTDTLASYDAIRAKSAFLAEFRKYPIFQDGLGEMEESRETIARLVDSYADATQPDFPFMGL